MPGPFLTPRRGISKTPVLPQERIQRVEGQGAVRRFSANAQGLAAQRAESPVPSSFVLRPPQDDDHQSREARAGA